jgi:serine/threonine protein phosphatase PrpC
VAVLWLSDNEALTSAPAILSHEDTLAIGLSAGRKPYNEDAVGAVHADGHVLLAVADGHWGNQVSTLAIAHALDRFDRDSRPSDDQPRAWFDALFDQVNGRTRHLARVGRWPDTPESTLLVAHVRPDGIVHFASLGDSFLYVLPLTGRPELANQPRPVWLGRRLAWEAEQAAGQRRSVSGVAPDYLYIPHELEVGSLVLWPGDVLLAASDGLPHCVQPEVTDLYPADLAAIVAQDRPLSQQCAALIEAALSRGGVDNVACALYRHPAR